jgi:hypothetical protein
VDCRTFCTGQSLLASITRTREPSVLSTRAWEQNSSSISETSKTVIDDHPNVTWPNSPAGTIFEFHDVALVVLFDCMAVLPMPMQRLALVFRFGNPEDMSTITIRLTPKGFLKWPVL